MCGVLVRSHERENVCYCCFSELLPRRLLLKFTACFGRPVRRLLQDYLFEKKTRTTLHAGNTYIRTRTYRPFATAQSPIHHWR